MLVLENSSVLQEMKTSTGLSVAKISDSKPTMVIFLRHLGCMFCKETLSDLQSKKKEILDKGTAIVLVHMTETNNAEEFFTEYDMNDIYHISDPELNYYKAFGLDKGDFKQLFGFRSWIGMGRAMSKGNFPQRKSIGDTSQMPGIFLIYNSSIIKSYIYKSVGDYPDYIAIASTS